MNEVRWGIIGVGDVCEIKSGPAFQKCTGSRLVAVMRRTGEKAKDFATRHGVPAWYSNCDDLIEDPNVNAVCKFFFPRQCTSGFQVAFAID